jgi:aspartyl-tRNA(Asn)/glutamyl-tRNA(Gln) amidotransferase subunit B
VVAIEIANWISLLVERIGSDQDPAQSKVGPGQLAELAAMVLAKVVSRDAARQVLSRIASDGGSPREIVQREGLGAITDDDGDELRLIVERAIASDPDAAEKVRGGNLKAVGPLVGYVMRETKGRADGGEVTRLIRELVAI